MTQPKRSILIVDDDCAFADSIAKRCMHMGLQTHVFHEAMEALQFALTCRPDVICLDVNMPSGSGLSVCELMTTNEQLNSVPVIMLTGSTDAETVRRCHHLCAYYVLKQPNVWADLESLLTELFELLDAAAARESEKTKFVRTDAECQTNQPSQKLIEAALEMMGVDDEESPSPRHPDDPPWVLMIDDDRDYSWAVKMRLEAHGVAVARAFAGEEGVQTAFAYPADAILLDFELPNGHGDEVLWQLKQHPITSDIPVIMVTGMRDRFLEGRIRSMGAAGFLTKPVDMSMLLQELSSHMSILPWDEEPTLQ